MLNVRAASKERVLQSLLGRPPLLWVQLQNAFQKLQEAHATMLFFFLLFGGRDIGFVWDKFNHLLQIFEIEVLFGRRCSFVLVPVKLLHSFEAPICADISSSTMCAMWPS
jgi:hypothetical protein